MFSNENQRLNAIMAIRKKILNQMQLQIRRRTIENQIFTWHYRTEYLLRSIIYISLVNILFLIKKLPTILCFLYLNRSRLHILLHWFTVFCLISWHLILKKTFHQFNSCVFLTNVEFTLLDLLCLSHGIHIFFLYSYIVSSVYIVWK